MPLEDPHRFAAQFRNERENLRTAENVAPADREAIQAFLRATDAEVSTLKEYCGKLRRLATFSDTPLVELDLAAANDVIYRMEHDYRGGIAQSTARQYGIVLRLLFQQLDREWAMKLRVPDEDPPDIRPDEMLDQADIAALVEAADYLRDVALIEFLADTGARVGLVSSLRVRDVDLEGDVATFTPNQAALGRKDAPVKPYPIIDARATLRNYLRTTHPAADDPDYPLFANIQKRENDHMTPGRIRTRLGALEERAGLETRANPHNFRHSAITRMWREGYSKQQIQHRVAWSLDTDMWNRYVHLHAEDMNRSIAVDAGEVAPEDRDGQSRRRCGNCHETVPPHRDDCPNCGSVVDPETRQIISELTDALDAALVAADDTAERKRVLQVRNEVQSNGASVDVERLHQLVSSLSD
jgi:integrase